MIKRWIKTAPALLLAVLLCVCAPALETGEACAFLQTERDAYVEYLLSLSLSNGAIALYRPTVAQYPSSAPEALDGVPAETYLRWRSAKLEPSAATAAARGLLTAGDAGRDAAEGYIEWYFSHLNTADEDAYGIDGTVYDTYFFIEDGDSPRLLEITGRGLSLPVLRIRRRTGPFNHRRPARALPARRGIGRAVLRGGGGRGGIGGRQRAAKP